MTVGRDQTTDVPPTAPASSLTWLPSPSKTTARTGPSEKKTLVVSVPSSLSHPPTFNPSASPVSTTFKIQPESHYIFLCWSPRHGHTLFPNWPPCLCPLVLGSIVNTLARGVRMSIKSSSVQSLLTASHFIQKKSEIPSTVHKSYVISCLALTRQSLSSRTSYDFLPAHCHLNIP